MHVYTTTYTNKHSKTEMNWLECLYVTIIIIEGWFHSSSCQQGTPFLIDLRLAGRPAPCRSCCQMWHHRVKVLIQDTGNVTHIARQQIIAASC